MNQEKKFNGIANGTIYIAKGLKLDASTSKYDFEKKIMLDPSILSRTDPFKVKKDRETSKSENLASKTANIRLVEDKVSISVGIKPTEYKAVAENLDTLSVKTTVEGVTEYGYTQGQSLLEDTISFLVIPHEKVTLLKPTLYFNCYLTNPGDIMSIHPDEDFATNLEYQVHGINVMKENEVRIIHYIEADTVEAIIEWIQSKQAEFNIDVFNPLSTTTNGFIVIN